MNIVMKGELQDHDVRKNQNRTQRVPQFQFFPDVLPPLEN